LISKVTICPFEDTDGLVMCADTGLETVQEQIDAITHPIPTKVEDLYLKAINEAQNITIRTYVCTFCDCNSQCHPTEND